MSEHAHEWETGVTRSGAYRKRCAVKKCRFHGWRSRPNQKGQRAKRVLDPIDRKVTKRVKARDIDICWASWLLLGLRVPADDTHHLRKKNTALGGLTPRKNAAFAVRLSRVWHDKTETGDMADRLTTTAEEFEGRVLWVFEWRGRKACRVVDNDIVE